MLLHEQKHSCFIFFLFFTSSGRRHDPRQVSVVLESRRQGFPQMSFSSSSLGARLTDRWRREPGKRGVVRDVRPVMKCWFGSVQAGGGRARAWFVNDEGGGDAFEWQWAALWGSELRLLCLIMLLVMKFDYSSKSCRWRGEILISAEIMHEPRCVIFPLPLSTSEMLVVHH